MDQIKVCNSWEEMENDTGLMDKQLEKLRFEKMGDEEPKPSTTAKRPSPGSSASDSSKGLRLDASNNLVFGDPQVILDSSSENMRSGMPSMAPKFTVLRRPNVDQHLKQNGHSKPENSEVKSQFISNQGVADNTNVNTNTTGGSNNGGGDGNGQKSLKQREQSYSEARMRIIGEVEYEEESESNSPGEDAIQFPGLTPAEILKQKIALVLMADNGSGSAVPIPTVVPVTEGDSVEVSNAAPSGKKKHKREKIRTTNPEPCRDFPVSKSESNRIIRQPRGPDGTTGFHRAEPSTYN